MLYFMEFYAKIYSISRSYIDKSTESTNTASIKCGTLEETWQTLFFILAKSSTVFRVWLQYASLSSNELIMSPPLRRMKFFLFPRT